MYGLGYSILIALANNVDNIGVRIAYSVRGVRLGIFKNLWISVITFLISGAAALLGSALGAAAGEFCHVLSMAVLVAIGTWFIVEPYRKPHRRRRESAHKSPVIEALKDTENSDIDNSKSIDFKEATLLGISLSINNIGGSMSAGMIGLGVLLIGVLSALVSFIALLLGNLLTSAFVRLKLGNKATVAAGVILILIGIRQVLP
ncbi:MAG: manganese efflux pump [Clostridia bacterium]|nr:manganese efflux pump [Clostridia bacterium]